MVDGVEWHGKWAELGGQEGLRSKHWRTRLATLHSLLPLPLDHAPLPILQQLLELLIFTLASNDANSAVRETATECAGKIFHGIRQHLSYLELDHFLWGFFTVTADKEVKVQNAAVEVLLGYNTSLQIPYFKDVIARLVQKFCSGALFSIKRLWKTKTPAYEVFKSAPVDMCILVPALEGVIHLQLLCTLNSRLEVNPIEIGPDLVPLLVCSCAALLEEYETSRNQSGANEIVHLLRSLGSSKYRKFIISMIATQSYDGPSIARWHKTSDYMDDDIIDLLENVETQSVLKGVSIALKSEMDACGSLYTAMKSAETNNLEERAVGHIIEALKIPSELVCALHETRDNVQARNFVSFSYYYLKIVDALLKGLSAETMKGDLVQGLLLTCAAIASPDNDTETTLSWIPKDIQNMASEIVRCLGTMLSDVGTVQAQSALTSPKIKQEADSCVERLILTKLPELIPMLKFQLRNLLSKNEEGNFGTTSSSVSLESSVIAAHQLYWCLKKVEHPHLGEFCTMIMPCALMALDHYSPHIKRQAMKLFIHLTENLNPSELRWYKDAILDCVTRNITGSGELWLLLVQMAVPLVLSIEGNNPRSKWYRVILNEMLGEVERHKLDAARFKVWLQYVDKLFEAMGLLLVVHFKRLLPLLFTWLHSSDDSITLLVLSICKVIIKYTWPRMPYHVEGFWKELEKVYDESSDKKLGSLIRSSVIDASALLKLCGGPAFEQQLINSRRESSTTCLGSALALHLSGESAKFQPA